jgi:hypothetical protein
MAGTSSLAPEPFYVQDAIIHAGSINLSIAKTMSIVVVLFTALTLTHAAFVDYRSGTETKQLSQMHYLQARKFGVETSQITVGRDCWRGRIREKWTEGGLECSAFELLVKMRGGPTRTRLLRLLAQPRNKLQMANEAGIDWKAVDRHVGRMLECSLVRISAVAGTCTVYALTEKGMRALAILDSESC